MCCDNEFFNECLKYFSSSYSCSCLHHTLFQLLFSLVVLQIPFCPSLPPSSSLLSLKLTMSSLHSSTVHELRRINTIPESCIAHCNSPSFYLLYIIRSSKLPFHWLRYMYERFKMMAHNHTFTRKKYSIKKPTECFTLLVSTLTFGSRGFCFVLPRGKHRLRVGTILS